MRRAMRFLLSLLGLVLGIGMAFPVRSVLNHFHIALLPQYQGAVLFTIFGLAFAIILFLLSSRIIKHSIAFLRWVESKFSDVPTPDILFGAIGLIVGLIIAYLITEPINRLKIPWLSMVLSVAIYILFAYLGINIATKRREELSSLALFRKISKEKVSKEKTSGEKTGVPKILDTSVIIDGRIFDICQTGFVEGPLVIPSFVLQELRHIADSSDGLKRNRGRRGLDILNRIQGEYGIEIYNTASEKSLDEIPEVDVKLLKLAQLMNGKVVTNDFNLNKVAMIKGVEVLNINELANTLKPVVLPGEDMTLFLVKEGKEVNQAVAYLDDGTMIVVEEGRKYIGQTINVTVTSVLQTAAGRMIFAKPKR